MQLSNYTTPQADSRQLLGGGHWVVFLLQKVVLDHCMCDGSLKYTFTTIRMHHRQWYTPGLWSMITFSTLQKHRPCTSPRCQHSQRREHSQAEEVCSSLSVASSMQLTSFWDDIHGTGHQQELFVIIEWHLEAPWNFPTACRPSSSCSTYGIRSKGRQTRASHLPQCRGLNDINEPYYWYTIYIYIYWSFAGIRLLSSWCSYHDSALNTQLS